MIFSQILFKFFDPNSECYVKYDAFYSHVFDYACIWRIAIEEVRNYGKIVYIKNTFEYGWWEDACPLFYPPRSAPGHKLQKPFTEFGIFQSLKGAWHNAFLPSIRSEPAADQST